MDREPEEMQFMGVLGIYKESYKMIVSWRKIFTQITISLILPLSFIFLAHIEVSNVLFSKIIHNELALDQTRPDSARYAKLSDRLSSEWAALLAFKALYFTFLLAFSLLSTAAVVYTIASVYTARPVSFSRVITVVPIVWKRLMVTFLWIFLAIFLYHVLAILVFVLWALTLGGTGAGLPALVVGVIAYVAGFVYLTIIWQLASVVSVVEEARGVKAMRKSRELIRGKMVVSVVVFSMLYVSSAAIEVVFEQLVVNGGSRTAGERAAYGVVCFVLLCTLMLFQLVIQTVIYFVCKSYHHENIDKSALSDHLEVYLGDYVPLKSKDVQLEPFSV